MLKTPREINVYGALGCLGQPRAVKGCLGQPWRPGEALWRPQGFWNSRVPARTSLVPAGTSLASLFFLLKNEAEPEMPLKQILHGLKWKRWKRKWQNIEDQIDLGSASPSQTEMRQKYFPRFSTSLLKPPHLYNFK